MTPDKAQPIAIGNHLESNSQVLIRQLSEALELKSHELKEEK
jgi:hypothetical protein